MGHPMRVVNTNVQSESVAEEKHSAIFHGFTKFTDFALILIPMVVGVGGLLLRTFLKTQLPVLDLYYSGLARTGLVQDRSLWFGMFIFVVFMLGISSAVYLVRCADALFNEKE